MQLGFRLGRPIPESVLLTTVLPRKQKRTGLEQSPSGLALGFVYL